MHRKWKFWLRGVHRMRDDILEALTDNDLVYTPGGDNTTLGSLLDELADTEASYIDSLETLTQEFKTPDVDRQPTIDEIRRRFAELDEQFDTLYSGWSDDDFHVVVTRPGDFKLSRSDQFDIYIQAVLIVLAKTVVYLRALGRQVPESAADWIG